MSQQMSSFQNNLDHARAAYRFAICCLPDLSAIEGSAVRINGFEFTTRAQVKSMRIELGWAFYCRYEACLEAELKRRGVKLSKKEPLDTWLKKHDVAIPDELQKGLEIYREIRNQLHHEDGRALDGAEDLEIHLMPDHMERFYKLFSWCGKHAGCAG